jgi:ferritin-like metal-binding protein YciE
LSFSKNLKTDSLKRNYMKKETQDKKTNDASGNVSRKTESNSSKSDEKKQGGSTSSPLLEKLFSDMLKDMYWAEKHLVEALPKMQKAATTQELQEAFEDHLYASQKHTSRLERVFKMMGKEAEEKKCPAMAGLTAEAESMMKETREGTMTRDAALIIAAQKIEHYEIATYGSLVQLALTMERDDVASVLEKTLWEEEETDQLLTNIAERYVNPMADEEDTTNTNEQKMEPTAETAAV